MNFKLLAVGAVVGMLAAIVPSCGTHDTCASTCAGCCTSAGECKQAESDLTCGTKGAACVDCSATQRTCNTGTHQCEGSGTGGGSSSCADSCKGCCQNGICLPESAQGVAKCGNNGAMCMACKSGQLCEAGACVTPPPSVTGHICSGDGDCASLGSGAVCRKVTMPGGVSYPMGYCTEPCTSTTACASDAVCVRSLKGETTPLCLARCDEPEAQSTCRDSYYCFSVTGASFGACWLVEPFLPDAGPPLEKVGEACANDDQCASMTLGGAKGVCIPETLTDGGPSAFTGGYCTGDCSSDSRLCSADGGAVCVPIGGADYVCEKSCNGPWQGRADCRADYVCYGYAFRGPDGGSRPSTTGVCEPNCFVQGSVYGCAAGAYCDAGYCVR